MAAELKNDPIDEIASEVMRAANNANPVEIFFKDGRNAIRGIIGITGDDHYERFQVEMEGGKIVTVETGDVQEIKSKIQKDIWIE
jgi:hypothetical protein